MTHLPGFKTKTMAEVYERQGHLEEAAEVYRYLIERNAGQSGLTEALSRVEASLAEKKEDPAHRIACLLTEWGRLARCYAQLAQLRSLRGRTADK